MSPWWIALAVLLFAAGCSVTVAELRIAAVHVPPPELLETGVSHGVHEGESCRLWVLGAPFGLPQVDEAIGNAMAPLGGVYMRDVTVFSEHPVYVVYGWHCYRVRGEVFAPPFASAH